MDWFLMKSVNAKYPLSHRKCAEKCNFSVSVFLKCIVFISALQTPKMVPSYSLVTWPPKSPKLHRAVVTPSLRKLWFSEGTVFWPKYSNSSGVTKSWQISKVTIRCHKRCLKLSWVQIWQKNSNGKCPKLPVRSSHALCYTLEPPKKL